ncbi:pyridoxamine 5'-phosphate oxidase family protein [Micrococcus sp. HG099]|uniref:pyridoxamine 5'-phosphate oxidase family protein n=1 Tax=Micrococcus sp. HG099 TaxID=2969755 RepID=UPI00215B26CF|nr:pyridoxamine 5'-phosphate oxidase family protein [Micrococcus sp. HG099]MCR8674704.1 pyridoxamine 5'-phosphate oxidase family protein [Micrococcus sp. HG099]
MTPQHHDTTDAPSMQRPDPVAEPGDHLMFEHPDGEAVLVLDEDQVWRLLRRVRHARLGLAVDGRPDIVPVNVRAHDGAVYFRTAPGSKLAELTVNPRVVVQADGILADQAWSVLVHGTARRLDTEAEIAEAESLGIEPWVPTLKDFYVRVDVQRVSGRHFVFGPHPERNESQTD